MAFDLAGAFAEFETPGQARDKRRSRLREERLDRSPDQTPEERMADTSGQMLAQGLRGLAGVKTEDEKVAEGLQSAFATIAKTHDPIPVSDPQQSDEDSQAAMEIESANLEQTGSQAEAKYIEAGLGKDEARLKAMDDVISASTIPEVARQLIFTRGQMAEDISLRRGQVAILKAQAIDEGIDRDIKEAELAKAQAEIETRGLEGLELMTKDDELEKQGVPKDHPDRVWIQRRLDEIAPPPEAADAEDPVTRRFRDKNMIDAGTAMSTGLEIMGGMVEFLETAEFSKTAVAGIDKFTDNLLTEVEALHPGTAETARKLLSDHFGDYKQYGEDRARFESMANMLILTMTDALIKGVPSNYDVGLIEKMLAGGVKDPRIFSQVLMDQGERMMVGFRSTAAHNGRTGNLNHRLVEETYSKHFLVGPRERTKAREAAKKEEDNNAFDPKTASLDELMDQMDLNTVQDGK